MFGHDETGVVNGELRDLARTSHGSVLSKRKRVQCGTVPLPGCFSRQT